LKKEEDEESDYNSEYYDE